MSKWIRTCQECGHKQEDKEPDGLTKEALDFGSLPSDDKENIEALNELKF